MPRDLTHSPSPTSLSQSTNNIIEFTPPGVDPVDFDPAEFKSAAIDPNNPTTPATGLKKPKPPTIDPALFRPQTVQQAETTPPMPGSGKSAVPVYEEVHKDRQAIGGDIAERTPGPDFGAMDFGERVDYLREVVLKNPLEREIHYKTLKFCCDRRTLHEVEDFIGACPEFPSTTQSQYYLLQFLLMGRGIEEFELDKDGNVIAPEQKEGLTEDEIDDLVATPAYETNEYGRELVEQMSPENRIGELLDVMPDQYDTFIEVLDFLTEKRSLGQVDALLRGRDVLTSGRDPGERPLQPSVFVDKLEKAAAIYWEKGWLISEDGLVLLETLKERRGD